MHSALEEVCGRAEKYYGRMPVYQIQSRIFQENFTQIKMAIEDAPHYKWVLYHFPIFNCISFLTSVPILSHVGSVTVSVRWLVGTGWFQNFLKEFLHHLDLHKRYVKISASLVSKIEMASSRADLFSYWMQLITEWCVNWIGTLFEEITRASYSLHQYCFNDEYVLNNYPHAANCAIENYLLVHLFPHLPCRETQKFNFQDFDPEKWIALSEMEVHTKMTKTSGIGRGKKQSPS